MASSSSRSLQSSTTRQATGLTPAQEKFNTLIGRINRQRKRLAEWQEIMPMHQEEVLKTFQPLRDSYAGFQTQIVERLDSHYVNNRIPRLQKEDQRSRRKKTARQLSREQREKEEESKISRSIRAV